MWWLLIQESKQRAKIIKNNLWQVIPLRALRFLAGREARLPQGHSKDWCPRKMTACNVLYIAGTVENCTLRGKQCLDLVNQYRWETQPTCEYLALMVQELIRAAEELKPWQTRHTNGCLHRYSNGMCCYACGGDCLLQCYTHFDLQWLNQNAAPYEGLLILNLSYVNVSCIRLSIH